MTRSYPQLEGHPLPLEQEGWQHSPLMEHEVQGYPAGSEYEEDPLQRDAE